MNQSYLTKSWYNRGVTVLLYAKGESYFYPPLNDKLAQRIWLEGFARAYRDNLPYLPDELASQLFMRVLLESELSDEQVNLLLEQILTQEPLEYLTLEECHLKFDRKFKKRLFNQFYKKKISKLKFNYCKYNNYLYIFVIYSTVFFLKFLSFTLNICARIFIFFGTLCGYIAFKFDQFARRKLNI